MVRYRERKSIDPRFSILGLDDRPYYDSLPPEVEFLYLHPSLFFDRARKRLILKRVSGAS
jgi:hypothetical protein